ncbi:MAG: UbiD family decarboxylase, partial [Synechococcaceae bacterium WBB_34_004]|nr:UbiD family decarboxylase [Synechococcaceae bacterium WBB_34_004]
QRDLFVLQDTPFDSLDFASERLGLGGRLAIDATTKVGPEKRHEWGEPLSRSRELEQRITNRWQELGLADLATNKDINNGSYNPDPSLFGLQLEHVLERLAEKAKA